MGSRGLTVAREVLRVLLMPAVLALRILTLPFKLFGWMLALSGVSLLMHGGYGHSWQAVEDGACGLIAGSVLIGIRQWVLRHEP